MPRTIASGMLTAISAESGEMCLLLELQFSGGNVFFASASQDISWESTTWTGLGGAFSFADLSENADLSSTGISITLSGVSQTIIAFILEQMYIGRLATLYLAHFNTNGQVIADPLALFQGYMNGGWQISETRPDRGGGTCTVVGRFTDRLAVLNERRGIQANPGSHQLFSPYDTFFSTTGQITAFPTTPLTWNTAPKK